MKEDSIVWLRKAAANVREFYGTSDPEPKVLEGIAAEIKRLRAENATLRELCRSAFVTAEHDFSCRANRPHQECTCWLTEWRESYVLQTGDNPALEELEIYS
jgi:hypothetical protein